MGLKSGNLCVSTKSMTPSKSFSVFLYIYTRDTYNFMRLCPESQFTRVHLAPKFSTSFCSVNVQNVHRNWHISYVVPMSKSSASFKPNSVGKS